MISLPENVVERLQRCSNFPSPPPVALKVIELAQDPSTDINAVAVACSNDPAIAAKVMKIANSALYSSRRKSTNLRQALIVLGLNATLTLALSFTLTADLRRDPPKGFDFLAYWRRTILAATWGKLLASELSLPFAEEVFIAALLQDIGMLAIDRIAPDTYQDIAPLKMDHIKLAQFETEKIGADHAAIGGWLLNSWNMPKQLVRSVSYSHDIEAAEIEEERRMFFRVISISGLLADAWLSEGDDVKIKRIAVMANKYLGLDASRLAKLFEIIREQLPVTEDLFEMDLYDQELIKDITDAAREILMIRNLHALSDAFELQRKASVLQSENKVLRQETVLDGLTGVGNRRYFEDSLDKEFNSSIQQSWALSMIFVDVDNFKEINDSHGHPVGDELLKELAKMINVAVRSDDIVARYGGDEFVILLPGSGSDAAANVADRIVEGAANCEIKVGEAMISTTLSLGVVTMNSSRTFETSKEFLAAADEALYFSKKAGRNQSTSYEKIMAA